MIDINLEEIKQKTSAGLSRYFSLDNRYRWTEYIFTNKAPIKVRRSSIFDLSDDIINDTNIIKTVSSKGDIHWACFGRFTYHFSKCCSSSRVVFELLPYNSLQSESINNHCWMTLDQLNYWIDTMKQDSGLRFSYKIFRDKKRSHILIDFKRLSRLQMKYVLFWIRYTYEYPASFLALDAMLLKRDYYPEETLQNLLTLVSVCQRNNGVPITSSQCLTTWGDFIQLEELRKRLRSRKQFVTELFGGDSRDYRKNSIYGIPLPNYYSAQKITGKSWIDNEQRFDRYTTVYPKMKEHEIKSKK